MAQGPWSTTGTSTANAALTVTQAAPSVGIHYIKGYDVTITGATAGADITCILKNGSTAIHTSVIAAGSPRGSRAGYSFDNPIPCDNSAAVNLAVLAGGASVITIGNIVGEEKLRHD